MLYGKMMKGYLKNLKGWRSHDVFGPLSSTTKLKQLPSGRTAICIGKEYYIKIPKEENFRFWSNIWNKKKVIVTGFVRLFFRGDQIVCVENKSAKKGHKKFLTLPSSWLSIIQKTGCKCFTSTIWAKGCQCGGA